MVTGRGGGHWGSHVVLLFFCSPPSCPLLALRTMPVGTIDALCNNKSIIIIGDAVIGSKQKKEDSIVVGCTLTDSQRAIRCCVCSCHQSLISLEESAPVQPFTEAKGRAAGVKLPSHLQMGDFAHFYPHILHRLKLLWQFHNDDNGRISGG